MAEDTLEAIQVAPDKVYVSLRRCCDCLGIDSDSQRKRLTDRERSPWATTVIMTAVAQDGKEREVVMIDLDALPLWLATIDVNRVAEAVRAKLLRNQKECAQVLRDHFFGKPPEDPILASLQSAVQVRQAQLALERKVEVTNRIAVEARALGQAALEVAEGNYGYYSVSRKIINPPSNRTSA